MKEDPSIEGKVDKVYIQTNPASKMINFNNDELDNKKAEVNGIEINSVILKDIKIENKNINVRNKVLRLVEAENHEDAAQNLLGSKTIRNIYLTVGKIKIKVSKGLEISAVGKNF